MTETFTNARRFSRAIAAFIPAFIFAAVFPCAAWAQPATSQNDFLLREHLGRASRNESVRFPLSPAQLKQAQAGRALIGPDGKSVAYQLVLDAPDKKPALEFLSDLEAFGARSFCFGAGANNTQSDLKIEEDAASIRVVNGQTGIAIRKTLADGQGPIASVRLASGKWIGDSSLQSKMRVLEYSSAVVSRGPVFAEVLCRAKFDNGKEWRLRARLNANEPVAIVNEEYSLGDESSWTLDLSANFSPDSILHRMGRSAGGKRLGQIEIWKIAPDAEPAFVLEPWLRWWMRDRQGNWLGVYNAAGTDLLAIGALHPGVWIDPQKKNFGNAQIPVTLEGGALKAKFSLQEGARNWMIGALDKAKSLEFADGKTWDQAPLPQQFLIKHGDFPLDMTKDYISQWQDENDQHPRLLVTAKDVARLRQNFKPDEALLARYLREPVTPYAMDGAIRYYLATGDEKLGRKLAEATLQQVQESVDMFTQQKTLVALGVGPHGYSAMLATINLADAAWPALTLDEREKVKAQLAFLAYTVSRADYWSPERGFSANPNMTTTVAAYQTSLGSFLKTHPQAKSWVGKGMGELKHQLDEWSDENGGWLEAPHYAMASYDYLIGIFLMAHNAGFNEYLFDPKMIKIGDWFAQISTPPDSRVGGLRHNPPIGNTWWGEPSGTYGLLAGIWKDKDPAFASRMQWMYRQHGLYETPGVGGFFPTLAGYRGLLLDASIPETKPEYSSALFPKTGVLLRNAVADRETQLHMIAGDNHAHYDKDSGSITFWGKGRIVADDFSYQGYMPGDDHSMITSPVAPDASIMYVQEFAPSPNFDYVRGQKLGWQRQIGFVKDADASAPNYFVLRDTMEIPAPATWRLWLSASEVRVLQNGALAVGKDDVDTDIIFVAPQNVALKTEEKTRETWGLDENLKYGQQKITQTGLIAPTERGSGFTVLLYPRLKIQKPPIVTSLSEGRVLQVAHEAGTDFIFLAEKPFSFEQGDIRFQGTSGLVKIRGAKTQLSLGAPGSLQAGGQKIENAQTGAAKSINYNLIANGDMETGVMLPFGADAPDVRLHEGNPVAGDTAHKGKFSLTVTLPEGKMRTTTNVMTQPIYVNRDKVYRVRINAYTPDKITLQAGAYANEGGPNLPSREGTPDWSWNLILRGPSEGWQTLETTIGPPGSGAQQTWPDKTLATGLALWVSGEKGTVYLDDFSFEPVETAAN